MKKKVHKPVLTEEKTPQFLENLHIFQYSGVGKVTYIYFILFEASRTRNHLNRVKVGYSVDPYKRLKALQTGTPVKLVLWYTFPVNMDEAKYLENQIHRKFRWSRERGEWFKIYSSLRKFIQMHKRMVRGQYHLLPESIRRKVNPRISLVFE